MSHEEIDQTVFDVIRDLKECDPGAKINVRGGCITIVKEPNGDHIYLDVVVAK
jgi:riboflavin synthase alpha subunit